MMENSKAQYKQYYEEMFRAVQNGDIETANLFRTLMEDLRSATISARELPKLDRIKLPHFVDLTLNKSLRELDIESPSNCINAAFNFHADRPTFEPYGTMEFLNTIRSKYKQLDSRSQLVHGDLLVFWSRSNADWKDRNISVEALDPEAPGFPFGLVFDHVAVYLGEDCLFHKPDPTLDSVYQINHWDDVIGFSEVVDGFELTFHRKIF